MLQRFELTRAARSIPEWVLYYAELWMGGMFLQGEAYEYMRQRRNPFASGMLYVVLIGLLVAVANILGAMARFATTPSVDAIKNIVLQHLQAMPFYEALGTVGQTQFENGFAQFWNLFGSMMVGYPTSAEGFVLLFFSLLTTPIGLVIGWVFFGALAHFIARRWNPEISLGEFLGPFALALSPQLLNILPIFPNVAVSAATIFFWFLVCAVIALRVTYRTTEWRALRAAFFPVLILALAAILLGVMAAAIVAMGLRGGQ